MLGRIYLRLRQGWNPWTKMIGLLIKRRKLIAKSYMTQREPDVIVSLTSIPTRVKQLKYTALSILNGDVIPMRVVLYISSNTSSSIVELKDPILNQLISANFLDIRVVADVGPHTKLIYALRDFPDSSVVVCDDDIIYPPAWLASLTERYEEVRNEKFLVTRRAHRIKRGASDRILPYADWEKEISSDPHQLSGKDIFPTGTGGILFPPGSMPQVTWSVKDFRQVAAKSDDIWFWFCALANGYSFTLTNSDYIHEDAPEIPNYNTTNLYDFNVNGEANDLQFNNCQSFFKEKFGIDI
jgi:hypothetical protein